MPDAIVTLTKRLERLEDRQAIADLIAGYGPAVDCADGAATAALWTEEGSYRIGDDTLTGAKALSGIVDFPQHQDYLRAGCGHVLSPHTILLDGDTAVAKGYSMVITCTGEDWTIARLSANHWRFHKTPAGWKAVSREARLLNGAECARALLSGMAPEQGKTT